MIYLTRPVLDIAINWAETPAQSFVYDLPTLQLGQASPRFGQTQQSVVRGWDLALMCETEARIQAIDAFTEALLGRVGGFWLPSPASHGSVITKIDNNTFDVPSAGLELLWPEDVCTHLVFQPASGSWYFGKIASVTDRRDGTERITLEADGGRTINVGDVWRQLLYVRLADDTESAEFVADHHQRRRLRVVELPTEYAETEAGQRPVYLYEITTPKNDESISITRWTNLDIHMLSNVGGGTVWTWLSFPVLHRGLRRSLRSGQDDLTLETARDPENPISAYVPGAPVRPLTVKVYETTFTAPNTVTVIFTGEIGETSAEGSKLTSKCSSLWSRRGRRFPRWLIQPNCNTTLFSAACGVNKASFSATGTVLRVDGPYLTLSVSDPPIAGNDESKDAGYWALGYIEWVLPSHDMRGIVGSSLAQTVTVGRKLQLTLDQDAPTTLVGQTVTMYAGCDRALSTCENKFENLARFGGFPYVPPENPSVRAMQAATANGNKK